MAVTKSKPKRKKIRRITTPEMELALARYFGWRQNLIVPNISWGFDFKMHECDLMVVTAAGYAWEVEIKVSRADLKKDGEKRHDHSHEALKGLYFAIPDYLLKDQALIPERAGILVANKDEYDSVSIRKERPAVQNKTKALDRHQHLRVARLGTMRIWSLKSAIETLNETIASLRLELDKKPPY